ncbi:response regulator transcription factor [Mucilaginibacter gotjawali]|uniref:Response regulator MprA n=2 Tax=Mucilaginibacter gotjawali TaxID=1550579 RepID=A0A120MXS9_9SPHI|nr:response regulator transcription factor [Mucilaginibacter gotjawali]MBB3058062.1 DNA-binding response OmpR family regulator [Mucilaginibacter gotjawali]BAU52037.1 Response regulator MprA [Mucilaginibacter gotjawali]
MANICLVEDEQKVAAFICKGLEENNYKVKTAKDGASAKAMMQTAEFDLLILDVMLPDISGIELCRQIRQTDTKTPIMMLTALDQVQNKVSGLKAGADDYLVKPFHFIELLARIEALLRRKIVNDTEEHILEFEDLKLDTWSNIAERGGKQVALTSKEFSLLELFLRHPNKVLSREYIAEQVWKIDFDTGTNFIDVYVNYLRNKIEKGHKNKLIHTVIGMGYVLKG